MLIRQMEKTDTSQVAEIEKENFTMPWSKNGFDESLDLDNTIFLVAEDEGKVVGYIGMYLSIDEGEITNVSVAKEYRRQRIATQLIESLEVCAKKSGINRIILEVRVSNTPAIKAYERLEFKSIGVRKNFYEKPKEDAYIMEVSI